MDALGLSDAPIMPAYVPPVPADIDIRATLVSIKGKRSNDPVVIADKDLISYILEKKFLGPYQLRAAQTLVKVCPSGTTDDQIATLLMGTNMSEDRARELVRQARPPAPPPVMAGGIASLANSLPLSAPAAPAPEGWSQLNDEDTAVLGMLRMDPEGEGVKNTPNNIFTVLENDSEVGGTIRFNGLTKQVEIPSTQFAGGSANTLATDIMNWLDRKWQMVVNRVQVQDQLLLIARKNEYNPVKEYLLKVKAGWDGKRRIDTVLIDYCGADDNEFNRRAGAMWMISACARGIEPGSKVDTVLILEGRQGAGKSKFLAALAGPWFSDTPLVIGNKDSWQMASYRWIIELAELASLRASETEAQKAFISSRIDNYRPPYGSAPEEFKRYAIFGGSTNQKEYLPDETGNRRYWPVAVGDCDVIGLRNDRDQLWAEAAYRYLSAELNPSMAHPECPGERWWFETEREQDMAAAVVEKRRPENTWAGLIREWSKRNSVGVNVRRQWTLAEIAKSALDIEIEKLPARQKGVAVAIKEAGLLPALGDEGQQMWKLPSAVVPGEIVDGQGLRDAN